MILLTWGIKWSRLWDKRIQLKLFLLETQKCYFVFDSRSMFYLFIYWFIYLFIYLFSNGHIHNVVLTLPNIVIIDVESDNIVSTLSKVVEANVEIDNLDSMLFNIVNPFTDAHNVVSTLIWRCATSRRISTWKQR